MSKVVDMTDRLPAVIYTVRLKQSHDGSLSVFVEDVADDQRSREAVADAMRRAADMIAGDPRPLG